MSELTIPRFEVREIWRWQYANHSFTRCKEACEYLIRENLSSEHPTYYALSAGIHASYCRPFLGSKGFIEKLDPKIIPPELHEIHEFLVSGRHKVFAHLDTKAPFNWKDQGQVEVSLVVYGGGHVEMQCVETTPKIEAYKNILILVSYLCDESIVNVRSATP